MKWWLSLGLCLVLVPVMARAASLTVVEARGGGARPGQRIDGTSVVTLREGEKLVLIAPDGRIVKLRGPYRGPASLSAQPVQNRRAALTALIALRNDRANSVGAVRSGVDAALLPDPWWIDVSRPGERCIRPGAEVVWWRPDSERPDRFSLLPLDRSWKADFTWARGQDRMLAPHVAKLESARSFVVRQDQRELPIRLNVIAVADDDPLVTLGWMLEKGCFQQADSLLRHLTASDGPKTPEAIQ